MSGDKTSLTQIAKTEQSLKEEQSKFDAVFYGADTHMAIFQGPELVFEMFNQKYQEIYHGRELKGKTLLEAVPELTDSPFPSILKRVYESGKSFVSHEGLARIFNNKTGVYEDRYFDTTFSRIDYGEGKPYRILATPKEVTDRVIAKKTLENNLKLLEQERELREKFVSALSHDLRTPLAIAKMGAQVLKLSPEDTEEVNLMADRISMSIDRADRMIRDLLDANRLKAGEGIPVVLSECRLDEILKYVVTDLRDIYGPRFSIPETLTELKGNWDEMALHRLIENLAINAIKYGGSESLVTLSIKKNNSHVEISVHNEGNPISPEDQQMLFNQPGRSKAALASGQPGWGIGLSLVKAITEAHKGQLTLTSDDINGTTFTVSLPC